MARETPLIPRSEFADARLDLAPRHEFSSDGRWLSWLEPLPRPPGGHVGGFRVHVCSVADPEQRWVLPVEPLLASMWTFGDAVLGSACGPNDALFRQLVRIAADGSSVRWLNPSGYDSDITTRITSDLPDLVVAGFMRGHHWRIQRINLRSGEAIDLWQGDVEHQLYWAVDSRLELRLLGQLRNPGKHYSIEWQCRPEGRDDWTLLPGHDEYEFVDVAGRLPGNIFLMHGRRDRDKFLVVDLTGARPPRPMTDAERREDLEHAGFGYGIKPQFNLDAIKARVGRPIGDVGDLTARQCVLVEARGTCDAWLYDADTDRLTRLHPTRRALPLARRVKVGVTSGGTTLNGFLTRPRGTRRGTRLPGVLVCPRTNTDDDLLQPGQHDFVSQWLANRGYVVLQVNTELIGRHRQFRELGPRHLTQLLGAGQWLVDAGHCEAGRIGVLGDAVLGAWSALWLLTEAPALFGAGALQLPPIDLREFVAGLDEQFGDDRSCFGDEFTDGAPPDETFLESLSLVGRLPLLCAALTVLDSADPTNDIAWRSGYATIEQLREHTKVTAVAAGNSWGAAIEEHFAKHLGGRAEPRSV